MRADFYHRLAEHPELRSLVAAQQVLLGPLDARGLRRAIEEPAGWPAWSSSPGSRAASSPTSPTGRAPSP